MTPEDKAVERLNALLTGARRKKTEAEIEIMQLKASIDNLTDPNLTREERMKVFDTHADRLPLPQQIVLRSYIAKALRESK